MANTLFRRGAGEVNCNDISSIQPAWIEELQGSYSIDDVAQEAITELMAYPYNLSYFSYRDSLLRYKGKLYVGSSELRKDIVDFMHPSSLDGHSGEVVTIQRIKQVFWWP